MMALRTNLWADGAGLGGDSFFDLAREKRQKLLELADKVEALAKYFRGLDEMTADHFYDFPLPVEGMAKLHLKQAHMLRALAGNATVPLSRQDRRGEREHSGLRARRRPDLPQGDLLDLSEKEMEVLITEFQRDRATEEDDAGPTPPRPLLH
jgi:hypothetical protein